MKCSWECYKRSYRRESDDDRHTHTHTYTHPCLPLILRAHKHSHILGRFFYSILRSTSWHTHTHTSSYELEICLTMTHSYPRLVALQNTYFSSTFTEAFLFHACGVTRNWHTYFISVQRAFLVETVVLQTVLWDIRAWSARFLVISSCFVTVFHSIQSANLFYRLRRINYWRSEDGN